jgi:hypothetical protein
MKLEDKIKELEELLDQEKLVKRNEVIINTGLQRSNEEKDITIEKLGKLNDELIKELAILKIKIKKLISD